MDTDFILSLGFYSLISISVFVLATAFLWALKLSRNISPNYEALRFDDLYVNQKPTIKKHKYY